MSGARSKLPFVLGALTVVILVCVGILIFAALPMVVPREPQYKGMPLRHWISAEPQIPIIAVEDVLEYRQEALNNMGEDAVRYLSWMIRSYQLQASGRYRLYARFYQRLPRSFRRFVPAPPSQRPEDLMQVVLALQLIGPRAHDTAPDLILLWDSSRNTQNATYNGFPVALAAIGNKSPKVIKALHERFNSPDRLHRALCALAAWRLDPSDSQAAGLVRAELSSTDNNGWIRYALLGRVSELGPACEPFLPEVKALIGRNSADPEFKRQCAQAAWRILKWDQPAKGFLELLARDAAGTNCPVDAANQFSVTALSLREVPGTRALVVPHLRELSGHADPSAASFASNILVKIESRADRSQKSDARGQ
jgi:hypothetical protein